MGRAGGTAPPYKVPLIQLDHPGHGFWQIPIRLEVALRGAPLAMGFGLPILSVTRTRTGAPFPCLCSLSLSLPLPLGIGRWNLRGGEGSIALTLGAQVANGLVPPKVYQY